VSACITQALVQFGFGHLFWFAQERQRVDCDGKTLLRAVEALSAAVRQRLQRGALARAMRAFSSRDCDGAISSARSYRRTASANCCSRLRSHLQAHRDLHQHLGPIFGGRIHVVGCAQCRFELRLGKSWQGGLRAQMSWANRWR
jgi:hypothetical protein